MSEKNDGGPAFPLAASRHTSQSGNVYENRGWNGMTLRDYFAAKAMQGLFSDGVCAFELVAEMAYRAADAMLAARNAP